MIIRKLFWCPLALITVLSTTTMQASTTAADEEAVIAAEQQWLKSQQTNNIELLAPLLADKVVETNTEGKLFSGKAAVLADAKSEVWSSIEYRELKVTVFGNTAIATGILVGKAKTAGGQVADERMRFTDTWVKMDGKWLCVANHDAPLKM